MFDHLGLVVRDHDRSRTFYRAALAPVGYSKVVEVPGGFDGAGATTGFCHEDGSDLWIKAGEPPTSPLHLAIRAPSRAHVDAFHAAAIVAGGTDNGAPGLRSRYHANYYAAYVLDPDGHNIEAVCHTAG